MISFQKKESLIKTVNSEIKKISKNLKNPEYLSELARAGYSTATGLYYEKSIKEISTFYNVSIENIEYWLNHFNIEAEMKTVKPRKRKKNDIFNWLKENVDNEITAKDISENCNISMPTVYNFINSNIGWFKKVRRGTYLIVDADKERLAAKQQSKTGVVS